MTEQTHLDQAHAAMQSAPENDHLRLTFFERIGDSELYLLLLNEAEGEDLTPQTFETEAGEIVLVFDRPERLSKFTNQAAPYAAVSGRILVKMLAEQNLGLGLNLEVASSSFLLDPQGVAWLAQTLSQKPDELQRKIKSLLPPKGLPEALLTSIDAKLASATGMAVCAYLVKTTYDDDTQGHLLGFIGALPNAQQALSQAIHEALTFSGIEAGVLDIGFFSAEDQLTPHLAQNGLCFDLPQPVTNEKSLQFEAPGSNPEKPPRLR